MMGDLVKCPSFCVTREARLYQYTAQIIHYLLEYSSTISSQYTIVILNNKHLMLEVLPMMEDHVLNKYLSHMLLTIKCNMNFLRACSKDSYEDCY